MEFDFANSGLENFLIDCKPEIVFCLLNASLLIVSILIVRGISTVPFLASFLLRRARSAPFRFEML